MKINDFLKKLDESPATVSLDEALATIAEHYEFTPVAFSNGDLHNPVGEAVRSCQLYAFGQLQGLTEQQTLLCFGEHYREVLADPQGSSHKTIRIFMKLGWPGVKLGSMPLRARAVLTA